MEMTATPRQSKLPGVIDRERIDRTLTSKHHRWLFHTAAETPSSLVHALKLRLPHIPAETWPQRLLWGGAYINGKPAHEDAPLPVPCKIEYFETKFAIEDAAKVFPPFDPKWIVYHDDYLLVCFKPAGLPAMPAREQTRYCLKTYLESYLGHNVHLPSRLDLSTAGLTLVSCRSTGHHAVQRLFSERRVDKRYLVQVNTQPLWLSCEVHSRIGRHTEHPVLRTAKSPTGKYAHTDFVRLPQEENNPHAFLEARPHTGRTHQIRVHAQALGLPLVGDNFYGGLPHSQLCLLSYALCFRHPDRKQQLDLVLPNALAPTWLAGMDLSAVKRVADSLLPIRDAH